MSSGGRAGHGRGNRGKRPFRHRETEGEPWQQDSPSEWEGGRPPTGKWPAAGGKPGQGNGAPHKSGNQAKSSVPERKGSGRSHVQENQSGQNKTGGFKKNPDNPRGERHPFYERPKWIPPKMNTDPLPVPNCPWCGKPIRDISSAIADKDSGVPVHFDCVLSRIAFGEKLDEGDSVSYIGGGRFGVICFAAAASRAKETQAGGRQEPERKSAMQEILRPAPVGRDFIVKKIIEWENKDARADWRSVICDHYSVT